MDEINYEEIIKLISKVEYDSYETTSCQDITETFTNLTLKFKRVKDFSKDQNYKTMKSGSDMLKDLKFYDVFFKPNSNLVNESHKINKLINKRDLEIIKSYTTENLFGIQIYNQISNFVNDIKGIESEMIQYNSYGNPNIVNSLIGLMRIDESFLTTLVVDIDIPRKRYVIKLFKLGRPKFVIIDDLLPVIDHNPSYIKTTPKDFWIIMVEKALAKINLSYCNIIRLSVSEILGNITDAPLVAYPHLNLKPREIWDILNSASQRNHLRFGEFETFSLEIFTPTHFLSYFIVDHFKVNNHKYVVLWIPLNKETDQVISKLKEKIQHIPKSDLRYSQHFPKNKMNDKNIIYVSFDNYYKTFYQTCVLKYNPKYSYCYKKIEINKEGYNIFKFKLSTRTKIFLTLFLKLKQKGKEQILQIPTTSLIILRKKPFQSLNASLFEEFEYEYVDSTYTTSEKLLMEMEITSGVYCVLFKINHSQSSNVIMSFYSDNLILIEEDLDKDNLISYHSLLSVFTSYLNTHACYEENSEEYLYTTSMMNKKFGFSLIKVENNSTGKMLTLDLTYESIGMCMISHRRFIKSKINSKEEALTIKLSPGKREFIIFEWNSSTCEPINIIANKSIILNEMKLIFKPDEFFLAPRSKINSDVNFLEVVYIQGVFIILTNESISSDYAIQAQFTKLQNLQIANEHEDNTVQLLLTKRSATYIHLKALGEKDILFKITFDVNKKD